MRTTIFVVITLISLLAESPLRAMGVDTCFNDPDQTDDLIRNCIGLRERCRQEPLEPPPLAVICRARATADSLSGLSGTNAIIGGRSLVHSDSAYVIAQVLGYSPWQAYQIMIYAEATDQSAYEPFDQAGRRLMTMEEIDNCYQQSMLASDTCLAITPEVPGLYKFNDTNGGQLLHEHARYSDTEAPPEITPFPTDYFSAANAPKEVLINNLRAWAFGDRDDLCVAGITTDIVNPLSPCLENSYLNFPMFFFGFAFGDSIPFSADLGVLMINDEPGTLASSASVAMAEYLPHDPAMARMGIYLHSLADRISHHMCTDRSHVYPTAGGGFETAFDQWGCAQGSHFLWHVWEAGTDQSRVLSQDFRTIEVALNVVWDELEKRGRQLGVVEEVNARRKSETIEGLIDVLGIYDSDARLEAMVELQEIFSVRQLPGHGRYADQPIGQWLQQVGAYYE
ncbi:MAG: hypothetical protein P8Q31_07675 [Luminiphilus sp.]|nr:hypothetical protein [Luminiphilus sp.]